jgi:septal ring factor EnvC (AmiA/AmiB activator)
MNWNFKFCSKSGALKAAGAALATVTVFGAPDFSVPQLRAQIDSADESFVGRLDAIEVRIDRGRRHVAELRDAAEAASQALRRNSAPLDTVRRARRKVRAEVSVQLVAWERAYRSVERAERYLPPGQAADTRILLAAAQPEALRARVDDIGVLQTIAVDMRRTREGVADRAGLAVRIAQSAGDVEAAEEGREDLVEQAHQHKKQAERELAMADEELENSLGMLLKNGTERDFHRLKGTLRPPVSAPIAEAYGPRKQAHSMSYVRHTGLTWKIPEGTPVESVAAGLVVFAGRMEGFGELVIIDHGQQYHSVYAHLKTLDVRVGEKVERGARLGASGQTGSFDGPKLYFELRKDGHPIDPTLWFIQH